MHNSIQINKDLFDIEKIKSMEPPMVLEETVKTILGLKPAIVEKKIMNELAYEMSDGPDFSIIEEYIDWKQDEVENQLKIIAPVYHEKELDDYQVKLFHSKENDVFPVRGYFVEGNVKAIYGPLGLLKIEFTGLPEIRVKTDIRHTQKSFNTRDGYKHYLYFYYDFDTKSYQHVYTDQLEKCQKDMLRDPAAVAKFHSSVQEYIKRELLVKEIKKRVFKLSKGYLIALKRWSTDTHTSDSIMTISSVEGFFKRYENFLKNEMTKNLKIKLIYETMSPNEYTKLLEYKEFLLKVIEKGRDNLTSISELWKLSEEEKPGYTLVIQDLASEENDLINDLNKRIVPMLQTFKQVRPSKFPEYGLNKATVLKGFIDYDLRTGEVFPNILQLEKRACISDSEEKEDVSSEDSYVKQIIQWLREQQA